MVVSVRPRHGMQMLPMPPQRVPPKPRSPFGNGQSIWGGMPGYISEQPLPEMGQSAAPADFDAMIAELNASAPKPQTAQMQQPAPAFDMQAYGKKFEKPGMTWSDKLGMLGGTLMDYDGTLGSGNADKARGLYEQRVGEQQGEFDADRQQQIMMAAAQGDPTALAMLDPLGNRAFQYGQQRDQLGDTRYAEETSYGRGRDQLGDQRYQTEYTDQRGDEAYQRQQDAKANAPRDTWQSAGDGYIFNNRTGESRSASGGSMPSGGGPAPSMEGLSEAFQQTPFSQLPVYGTDGTQQVQSFKWSGTPGGGNVEDRRGLMEPNREGNARGDKKLDETVAKDLAAWKTGNRTTAFTNLQRLQSVITDLESGANLSGPVTGALPGWAQAAVNPQALATKQAVDSVIQQSLKAILGGQFTEKEAQGMLERAYNPRLSEAENAKNLKLIYNDLVGRSTTMEMMSAYQDQYGTVQGFQSPTEGVQDFKKDAAGSVVPDGAIKALQANPMLRSQFEAKYGQGSASQYLDGQGAN